MKHKRESIHEKRYLYRDKTGQDDRSEEEEEEAEAEQRKLKKRRLKKRRLKKRYHIHERNSDKRKNKVKN